MKTLKNVDIKNKTVILRCDLNVTIKDNKIIDDNKIKKSLKTINYLLENGNKVLIMSHLGKIKNEEDKEDNDMQIVYERLNVLLPNKIQFINETHGSKLKKAVKKLEYGKALLMQNTRYEDLNKNKESNCDKRLAKSWAKLGDVFINDAFGTIHRKHASNYGISCYLPSYIGFLVEEELKNLNILDNPNKPFVVIMGGSKVSDKIKVIESLIKKADYILIGGAMSFPFLKAKGYNVGSSIYDENDISYCKELLEKYPDKIVLPIDLYGVYSDSKTPILQDVKDIPHTFTAYDIGDETIKHFQSIIKTTETVFWNGPLGKYEDEDYIFGTKKILEFIIKKVPTVILGGGDIISAATILGLNDKVTFASTGGGATLKYIENHKEPGLENMK